MQCGAGTWTLDDHGACDNNANVGMSDVARRRRGEGEAVRLHIFVLPSPRAVETSSSHPITCYRQKTDAFNWPNFNLEAGSGRCTLGVPPLGPFNRTAAAIDTLQ